MRVYKRTDSLYLKKEIRILLYYYRHGYLNIRILEYLLEYLLEY